MEPNRSPTGKIAFMFPAKFNLEGARSPVLNFQVREDEVVAMSVGISFLELDQQSPYFVTLQLFSPSNEEVEISAPMNAIPPEQIDPIKKSSFLTASFYFEPIESGSYRFFV